MGAGTGKATVLFLERGLQVVAIEPSAEMAAVAGRNSAGYENVTIEQIEFERWRPDGRPFRLVFSAQAWHWVKPDPGFGAARAVLEPGGALAVFWNRPDWGATELGDALGAAYRRSGDGGGDLMDPNSPGEPGDWFSRSRTHSGSVARKSAPTRWGATYTTAQYIDLLGTQSANLVLTTGQRERPRPTSWA